jgi:hypothetical protein
MSSKTKLLSQEDCEKLIKHKDTFDKNRYKGNVDKLKKTDDTGSVKIYNPLTSRYVTVNSYNQLLKQCDKYSFDARPDKLEKKVTDWISSCKSMNVFPDIDEESEYSQNYKEAMEFFGSQGITDYYTLRKKLPSNHLLFNKKLDILFNRYYYGIKTEKNKIHSLNEDDIEKLPKNIKMTVRTSLIMNRWIHVKYDEYDDKYDPKAVDMFMKDFEKIFTTNHSMLSMLSMLSMNKYEIFILYKLVEEFVANWFHYINHVYFILHHFKNNKLEQYKKRIETIFDSLYVSDYIISEYDLKASFNLVYTAFNTTIDVNNKKHMESPLSVASIQAKLHALKMKVGNADLNQMTLYQKKLKEKYELLKNIYDVCKDKFFTDGDGINYTMPKNLSELFVEIFHIYNYEYDRKHSPFNIKKNNGLSLLPDPIKTILKQLGYNELNKPYDLDIKENVFETHEEYLAKYREYDDMKQQYEEAKINYVKALDSWEENPSGTQPKAPAFVDLVVPVFDNNGKKINKTIKVPRDAKASYIYWSDSKKYSKKSRIERILADLLEKGFTALMQEIQSRSVAKTNGAVKNADVSTLLDKDRQYFRTHILNGEGEDNPEKCKDNYDTITQENFDDPDYLLAKLQLMFRIHTKNEHNKTIRTDCYYAPALYNEFARTLVGNFQTLLHNRNASYSKLNKLHHVILRDKVIEQKDIDALMKIIHFIYPEAGQLDLDYVKPSYDSRLFIKHAVVNNQGHDFCDIIIYRRFQYTMGVYLDFDIKTICCIPLNMSATIPNGIHEHTDFLNAKIQNLFGYGKLLKTYLPPYYSGNHKYAVADLSDFDSHEKWLQYINDGEHMKRFVELATIINNML